MSSSQAETSFTLVEGTGDTDNASFTIDDDQLKIGRLSEL